MRNKKPDISTLSNEQLKEVMDNSLKKETCFSWIKGVTYCLSMLLMPIALVCSASYFAPLILDCLAAAGLLSAGGFWLAQSKFNKKYYKCQNELSKREAKAKKEQEKLEEQQVEVTPVIEKTAKEIAAEDRKAKEEKVNLLSKLLKELKEREVSIEKELKSLSEDLEKQDEEINLGK